MFFFFFASTSYQDFQESATLFPYFAFHADLCMSWDKTFVSSRVLQKSYALKS